MPMPRNCDAHMPGAGVSCAAFRLLSPTFAIEEPVEIVLPRVGGGPNDATLVSSFPSAE